MRNTGPIAVRKLHPLFGAEVSGIDITRPLSAREFGPIRAAFEEHSVLLFRDQPMDDDKQIAFSENFGPLETTGASNPAAGTKFQRQSNLDIMTGEPIPPDDMRMIYQKANYFWHSDSSFKRVPSLCSILTARVCPPEGGNTEFLCMRAAWDALPAALKATVEPLIAEHSLQYSRDRVQKGILSAKALSELPPSSSACSATADQRPSRACYRRPCRPHRRLAQRSAKQSCTSSPIAPSSRSSCSRNAWREGDVIVWDNRAVLHRATHCDAVKHKRLMQRTTIGGDS
jgi:alpha-ketoglutarate-dependent 2,4-dichlorophenoxyacetate dioxygenase